MDEENLALDVLLPCLWLPFLKSIKLFTMFFAMDGLVFLKEEMKIRLGVLNGKVKDLCI